MSREYLMVRKTKDGDIATYGLEEKDLFKFLNDHTEDKYDEDICEDIPAVVILDSFPMPNDSDSYDDDGKYCPTYRWPDGGVYIIKDGKVFIPSRKEHQKTITVNEYVAPTPALARQRRTPAKKSSKKSSKK